MQIGEQKPFAGKFDKFEGLLQRRLGPRYIVRRQEGLGKTA